MQLQTFIHTLHIYCSVQLRTGCFSNMSTWRTAGFVLFCLVCALAKQPNLVKTQTINVIWSICIGCLKTFMFYWLCLNRFDLHCLRWEMLNVTCLPSPQRAAGETAAHSEPSGAMWRPDVPSKEAGGEINIQWEAELLQHQTNAVTPPGTEAFTFWCSSSQTHGHDWGH